jgi:hypothetical protein
MNNLSEIDQVLFWILFNTNMIPTIVWWWIYLQNVYAPDEDPNMEVVNYDRTVEQNEDLGLNDMKTENYEES